MITFVRERKPMKSNEKAKIHKENLYPTFLKIVSRNFVKKRVDLFVFLSSLFSLNVLFYSFSRLSGLFQLLIYNTMFSFIYNTMVSFIQYNTMFSFCSLCQLITYFFCFLILMMRNLMNCAC